MEFNLIFTLRAEERLDHLLEFLSKYWGEKVHGDFISELEHCLTIIKVNPHAFSIIDNSSGLRKCVITPLNILYYIVHGNDIIIVSLENTRMDPDVINSF